MWKIYKLPLNKIYTTIKSLQLHEEKKRTSAFWENPSLLNIVANAQACKTMLTEYYQMNQIDEDAHKLLYREFPDIMFGVKIKNTEVEENSIT